MTPEAHTAAGLQDGGAYGITISPRAAAAARSKLTRSSYVVVQAANGEHKVYQPGTDPTTIDHSTDRHPRIVGIFTHAPA
ncbi:hypothetical protein [Mangrovactinospora gilvigrisea]|nr:hypothetical protein [Mangrovactinospora gilvigrisea]